MRTLLAALMFVSFSAMGGDIIRIEGGRASCKTKADVLLYQTSAVYRPVNLAQHGETASLTVEFLRCVEQNGKFAFVRDRSFENHTVTVEPGPLHREELAVDVIRNDIQAVTFNTNGFVLNRSEMQRNGDSTYSQTLPIGAMDSLETDRNGERFFEMAVSYKVMIKNRETGKIIDSKREYLGSYRVFVK